MKNEQGSQESSSGCPVQHEVWGALIAWSRQRPGEIWVPAHSVLLFYFNLTKSRTKIAHTPTVTGNRTNCASRSALPRGTANVSNSIAKAVRTPRDNLVLEFTVCLPHFQDRRSCTAEQQQSCDQHHPRKTGGLQLPPVSRITNRRQCQPGPRRHRPLVSA